MPMDISSAPARQAEESGAFFSPRLTARETGAYARGTHAQQKKSSPCSSLSHFVAANRPAGAADRCVECSLSNDGCPYSAERFYLGRLEQQRFDWPLNVITQEMTKDGVMRALREGPYGRCVYTCDNDVVDHQVVAMEFEDGISAELTMNAFTAGEGRLTEIFGSRGELRGDSDKRQPRQGTEGRTAYDDCRERAALQRIEPQHNHDDRQHDQRQHDEP